MKGKIICIEGIDGAGKQTQTEILYNYLKSKNINVIIQSFPNYEYESSMPVRMYLKGDFGDNANCLDAYQASILFGVDRMLTYKKYLQDHYENGGYIIFDRYVPSNMIHQASKIDDLAERDRYLAWLDSTEYGYLKLPRPDLVFFLKLPFQVSKKLADSRATLKNKEAKDIHEQNSDYLKKSYDCGLYLASKYNWKQISVTDENDNLRDRQDIFCDIKKILDKEIDC